MSDRLAKLIEGVIVRVDRNDGDMGPRSLSYAIADVVRDHLSCGTKSYGEDVEDAINEGLPPLVTDLPRGLPRTLGRGVLMEPRIEIVTPCEHGETGGHVEGMLDSSFPGHWERCPGGSRLVYTREEAFVLAVNQLHEHGDLANGRKQTERWRDCPRADAHEGTARRWVDALLGVGE